MNDIRQELLTAAEVARMLGMRRTAFYEFREANGHFPKPVVIGQTSKGRTIERWQRKKVEAFIDLAGT